MCVTSDVDREDTISKGNPPSPANGDSPEPSSTGATWSRSSSICPARRYWLIVEAPPATEMCRSPAASRARRSATSGPPGHEVERRPALHLDRLALVMRQHEDRRVVRRVV